MYENRIEKAHALFKEGYNCAQSVVAAFADLYGLTFDQSLKVSASFGGGIGRMRLTCGAACGMFILAGLETGSVDPKDREAKLHNYEVVRRLANKYKEENGSIVCAELLGLTKKKYDEENCKNAPTLPRKRPCDELVRCAAKIYADFLESQQQLQNQN